MARMALAVVLLSLLSAGANSAEIYRWTDAEGKLHFTQDLNQVPEAQRSRSKPPAQNSQSRLLRYSPPTRDTSADGRGSQAAIRIPFERRGNVMWVEAVVNDRRRVPFIVDTGASGVTLPSEVVQDLGIPIRPDTPRVNVGTANGLIRVPRVQLSSLQLGDARIEQIEATVNPTLSVGLLGGSFFNNFTYSVDAAAGMISLVPNDGVRAGAAAAEWRERFQDLRGSISSLETYLAEREVTRPNRRKDLESNLERLKQELNDLEIEANHARVPKAWRQ